MHGRSRPPSAGRMWLRVRNFTVRWKHWRTNWGASSHRRRPKRPTSGCCGIVRKSASSSRPNLPESTESTLTALWWAKNQFQRTATWPAARPAYRTIQKISLKSTTAWDADASSAKSPTTPPCVKWSHSSGSRKNVTNPSSCGSVWMFHSKFEGFWWIFVQHFQFDCSDKQNSWLESSWWQDRNNITRRFFTCAHQQTSRNKLSSISFSI